MLNCAVGIALIPGEERVLSFSSVILKVDMQVCERLARLPQLQELVIGYLHVMSCTQLDVLRGVATALRNLTHMQFRVSFETAKFGHPDVIPSALFLQAVAAEVTKLQTLKVRTRLLADFGALRCECWV